MPDAPAARILIVDDEVALMKALCDTLRGQGFETVGVSVPNDALAALQGSRFDVLLADLMMPEMDGITLLRAALESDPDLVGIIMTGQGTIDTAVDSMKTGALDYILKPFKLGAILPVLSRALAMRRLRLEKAELQEHVRERSAELEVLNKELEAFAHSVSHDLQAPVRSIRGHSQMMLESASGLTERDRQLLQNIRGSAEHMRRLIEGLLAFSCLGRQPLSKQTVPLARLVQDVLNDVRKQHEGRQVEVQVSGLADCTGDPALLKHVFANLLSNAFKFTRRREKAVVEVGCRSQPHETVYYVRDNGAGFNMQYAGNLFGVFQRLHRSDEFEGSGVGLSIVQRIIQRHGGRIWAEAEVDKGATFQFTLPSPPDKKFSP